MSGRDFASQLRKEDELRRASGLSPGARRALRERIDASIAGPKAPRRARALYWTLAPAGALALAVMAWVALRAGDELGALRVADASADLQARVDEQDVVEVQRGSCTLVDEARGIQLRTAGPVRLRHEASGVRVLRGHVAVSVKHRAAPEHPAVVLVSGGQIEVMGTRFSVQQEEKNGTVTLEEGKIRFRATSGQEVLVKVGQTLAWPLVPAVREEAPPHVEPELSPPEPEEGPRKSTRHRAVSEKEFLRHVDELRSRGDFEGAVKELRRGMSLKELATVRERLSFELGAVLSNQVKDPERACAQWAWHVAHFPAGRFDREVQRVQESLDCR